MELDEARSARAQVLLAGELDWTALLKLASRHALAPLLHWHLSRRFPGRAPQSAAHLLEEQFRANVQSNLKLAAELIRVLKLLEGEKVFAIPFKGPALTAALYGNLALRESSDLDLLLRPDHILRARDVLLADGYVPEYDLTPAQERALLRSDCQYTFQKFDGQLRIELHWDIAPRYCGVRLDPGRWFERAQSVTLTSVTVPSLSPEDLLLVLCVHGAKHAWERAAWIVDVAELLRVYPALDFTYVAQQAGAARARRHLRVGLGLANQVFEVQLPPEVAREVEQDGAAQSLIEDACRSLTGPAPGTWQPHRFMLLMLGPRGRAAYLLGSALTPTPAEWGLVNLPPFLFPLYRPLRLARLGAKYAQRVWQALAPARSG